MITGARKGETSWLRRLAARASSKELAAFVVPGPEVARAFGLDLGAAGLRVVPSPRHASVLVVVGGLPEGLRDAASVIYAQMMRPRAVLVLGSDTASPLPGPDVSAPMDQESLSAAVARLRRAFAEGAWDPGVEDYAPEAAATETRYTCPMHPEVVQKEPGACPKCGMDLVPREVSSGESDGEEEEEEEAGELHHGSMDHGEHGSGGHEHMDHTDMGFMSMVEMTRDLQPSGDGLRMEWVEVPFGPLFPGLPGGLALTFTLDGDTVACVQSGSAVGRGGGCLQGVPVDDLLEHLGRIDPLSPVAYRVLALRAVENAAGVEPARATAYLGALEHERVVSHLGWLSSFGYLIGYEWLHRRAAGLQLALLRDDTGEGETLWGDLSDLLQRLRGATLLRRRLEGVGRLRTARAAEYPGPVSRAAGLPYDVRSEEKAYQDLGFEPAVQEGNDAYSRLMLHLDEMERSQEIVQAVGSVSAPDDLGVQDGISGEGDATVETPRGPARLRVRIEDGMVRSAELETPSGRHAQLVEDVALEHEVADALAGVASLDLSPWGMTR